MKDYSFYAKCNSEKCPKYDSCARAKSNNSAEVNYLVYCNSKKDEIDEPTYQWWEEIRNDEDVG
jgi:hypothetical protein